MPKPRNRIVAHPSYYPGQIPTNQSRTILVVDDCRAVRSVVTRLLVGSGYLVVPAANHKEAMSIWSETGQSFGLVITDLCTMTMSRHVFVDQLLGKGATIPILVTSSWVHEESIRSMVNSRQVDFLAKPFSHNDILIRVRELLYPNHRYSYEMKR